MNLVKCNGRMPLGRPFFFLKHIKDLPIILVKLEEFNIQRYAADERSKRHTGLQPMVGLS